MAHDVPGWLTRRPFAHRGLHGLEPGVVENSLSAYRAAAAKGYGIELDVQPSRDGVPMVFHDATLDRMTRDSGPVRERTAADLAGIALTGTADRIPTLAQALETAAGRVAVLVEVKADLGDLETMLRAVADLVEPRRDHVAVMSFDPAVTRWFRDYAEKLQRGLVGPFETRHGRLDRDEELAALEHVRPSFLSYRVSRLDAPVVAEARTRGLALNCWTVRTAWERGLAEDGGADTFTFEGFLPA